MVAFRRWGHFYLALSNEALKKRTKEKNQARSQVRLLIRSGVCSSPTLQYTHFPALHRELPACDTVAIRSCLLTGVVA